MMTVKSKCSFGLSLMTLFVGVTTPAPHDGYYVNVGGYGFPRYEQVVMVQDPRGFWDFLGNWIQNSNWLPVEVNIPDTIGSITSGISNFTNGIIQRIPFLNNNSSNGAKPIMLLLPVFKRKNSTTEINDTTVEPTEVDNNESTDASRKIIETTSENFENNPFVTVDEETVTTITTTTNVNVLETEQASNEISFSSIEKSDKVQRVDENRDELSNLDEGRNIGEEELKVSASKKDLFPKSHENLHRINYRIHDQNRWNKNKETEVTGDILKMLDEDGFWAYF